MTAEAETCDTAVRLTVDLATFRAWCIGEPWLGEQSELSELSEQSQQVAPVVVAAVTAVLARGENAVDLLLSSGTVRNAEGETCVQGNRGSESCNVLLGLDCVAGRCRRVGTGALDSPCFSSRYGVDNCTRGLYCSAATQTCQRRKADGMPCRSGEECESRECVTAPGAMATTCGVTLGCR